MPILIIVILLLILWIDSDSSLRWFSAFKRRSIVATIAVLRFSSQDCRFTDCATLPRRPEVLLLVPRRSTWWKRLIFDGNNDAKDNDNDAWKSGNVSQILRATVSFMTQPNNRNSKTKTRSSYVPWLLLDQTKEVAMTIATTSSRVC